MTDATERLAATWFLLARLFSAAPDAATLDRVRAEAGSGSWPLPLDAEGAAGLTLLVESERSGESADAVRDDHFRLFRGPAAVAAPPWASVHLSPEKLLFEDETFAVREAYARHGLAAPLLNREPDDHIALELEFCATLLSRSLDADEASDADAAAALRTAHDEFVRDHLLSFAPSFFALVRERAATRFYRGVAALGTDAVAGIAAALGVTADEPTTVRVDAVRHAADDPQRPTMTDGRAAGRAVPNLAPDGAPPVGPRPGADASGRAGHGRL